MKAPRREGAKTTRVATLVPRISCVRTFVTHLLPALCLLMGFAFALTACGRDDAGAEFPVIDLDDRFGDMRVLRQDDGSYLISVQSDRGRVELTPEAFARIIHLEKQRQEEAGLVFVIFNITTWWGLLWISVGLMGQLLFTFRMVLQWLASEKEHRSVVPVGFWWGSLLGGLMLLTYFIWRKDIVGILGQSTGAFIYTRNLWLIYTGGRQTSSIPAPAPDTGDAHA